MAANNKMVKNLIDSFLFNIITLLLIILFDKPVFSQPIKQSVFYELGGNSRSFLSANYERLIPLKDYAYVCFRTGIAYNPGSDSGRIKGEGSIPLVISILAGKGSNFLEFGLGYTASFGKPYIDSSSSPQITYKSYESAYIIRLGYRFMKMKNFMIEAAPVYIWAKNLPNNYQLSFGLSLGYAF
jgi:hypothetical protein